MAKFKIVIKKNCFFCDRLKEWLADKDIDYQILDYQDPKDFNDPLMNDPIFNSLYCDMGACVEGIPIIVKDNEEIFYSEIWDLVNNILIEERARNIFEI